MAAMRRWLKCVCLLSFLCGVVVPLVLLVVANGYDELDSDVSPFMATVRGFEGQLRSYERKPLDYNAEVQVNQEDVQYQVQDLQRIVVSVRNELRQLEQERNQVRKELDMSRLTLSRVRKEVGAAKSSLQDSKGKLAKAMRDEKRANQYENLSQGTKAPVVVVNLPMPAQGKVQDVNNQLQTVAGQERGTNRGCFDELCFDYSRCPLTSPFTVYVYNQHLPNLFDLTHPGLVDTLVSSLEQQGALVEDPALACVLVVLMGPVRAAMEEEVLESKLMSLPYWNGGTNHVLMDLAYHNHTNRLVGAMSALGHAILAKSYSSVDESPYDIITPPITEDKEDGRTPPPFLPALRQNLLVFEGNLSANNQRTTDATFPLGSQHVWVSDKLLTSLREAIRSHSTDRVVIAANCSTLVLTTAGRHGEWLPCGSVRTRAELLTKSTFSLILGSKSGVIGPVTYARLMEALQYGAVPVIIGVRHLPFQSVIDWSQVGVVIPPTSLGQLHYILRNIDTDTVLQYRRQGRFLWDTYFSSPAAIVNTVMAVVRQRFLHPPPPALDYTAPNKLASVSGDNRVLSSPVFQYNLTTYTTRLWNAPPGPFYMYPTTPFKPTPMSGSQYADMGPSQVANLPQHVIAAGGITGPFFEDYLLGNVPDEQFTVVMLTYERNEVLLEALKRLKDLDNLAKVVVVWNSPKPPPPDMKWPDIGADIDVVSTGRNSLNNRFLPFSNIKTEAVLSIDDDVHLRHDEIQFAFRVWREARDRVVGFPARFHAWDTRHPGWLYNSNYTCELSMVLTGAAFIHKYYMFLYSYWLYPEAREIVDRYLNCEDILMNFLVSHITRKPPLKVTSRWTFRCPGCPETLSSSDEHFNERHVCMNAFVQLFGYIPLLYTQFRLDSVLFKTRLPSHLEKCYEFI